MTINRDPFNLEEAMREIRSLRKSAVSQVALQREVEQLKAHLKEIDAAIQNPALNLYLTAAQCITQLNADLAATQVVLKQALAALIYHTDQTRPINETGLAIAAIQELQQ
jgi:hypothetical protein